MRRAVVVLIAVLVGACSSSSPTNSTPEPRRAPTLRLPDPLAGPAYERPGLVTAVRGRPEAARERVVVVPPQPNPVIHTLRPIRGAPIPLFTIPTRGLRDGLKKPMPQMYPQPPVLQLPPPIRPPARTRVKVRPDSSR